MVFVYLESFFISHNLFKLFILYSTLFHEWTLHNQNICAGKCIKNFIINKNNCEIKKETLLNFSFCLNKISVLIKLKARP